MHAVAAHHHKLSNTSFIARMFDAIGQSRVMRIFNDKVQAQLHVNILHKIMPCDSGVSSGYQALGLEAQSAIGIPKDKQLPIKKLSEQHPLAAFAGAIAEPDAIYVNEKRLQNVAYGVRRFAMFHEAVHVLHNDMATDQVIELCGYATIAPFVYRLLSINNYALPVKIVGSFVTATAINILLETRFLKFVERRADCIALERINCAQCVKETIDRRRESITKENNPLWVKGYIMPDEMEVVERHYRSQNKFCEYHSNKKQDA